MAFKLTNRPFQQQNKSKKPSLYMDDKQNSQTTNDSLYIRAGEAQAIADLNEESGVDVKDHGYGFGYDLKKGSNESTLYGDAYNKQSNKITSMHDESGELIEDANALIDKPLKQKEHAYPGYGNKLTPDTLYTSDGKKIATSQIDEAFLGDSTKTDSLGQHAVYRSPSGRVRDVKYYYKEPIKNAIKE